MDSRMGRERTDGERTSEAHMDKDRMTREDIGRERTEGECAHAQSTDGAGPVPPRKPGFFRRLGRALSAAMGWPCGRRFLSSLSPQKPLALCSRTRMRLADNLAREDEAREDFARLLRLWGIREEELEEHAAMRRREAVGTGFLTLVSAAFLAANFLNPAPVPLVRLLATFAAASFLAASLLMCLAAIWQTRVLRKRHFVPFLSWLCSPLVPGAGATDGTGRGAQRPDGQRPHGERR